MERQRSGGAMSQSPKLIIVERSDSDLNERTEELEVVISALFISLLILLLSFFCEPRYIYIHVVQVDTLLLQVRQVVQQLVDSVAAEEALISHPAAPQPVLTQALVQEMLSAYTAPPSTASETDVLDEIAEVCLKSGSQLNTTKMV